MSEESSIPKFLTRGIGRRKFLKNSALAVAGTTSLAAFLAACGDNTAAPAAATTAATSATTAAGAATTAAGATSAASATTAAGAATTAASGAATGGAIAPTAAAPGNAAVTLTYLIGDTTDSKNTAAALVDAYKKVRPNVTIKVETRPGGSEGDNLIKTRLATGEMSDIFNYNAGSQLQGTKPSQTLVDISKEPYLANVADVFIPTVSQNGMVFGVPTGTALAGGILYNKKVYTQLGLSVPKTWADFEANNDKIKAAGIAPVIATYGTTWTSQLFILADYYNVAQTNPKFADDYTANKVKFANDPAASSGFTYLQEGFTKGWYQKDFATTTYEQGLKLLADGTGAHYPMLTVALSIIATNYPDKVNDIGFFGLPGKEASKAGATVWMPTAVYIPKTSKHIPEAKDFQAFVASLAGVEAITAKVPPTGPYVIKGAKLPDTVLPAVKDITGYIDSGKSTAALEFFSPIKGPALEQFCVAVGSGQMTPQQAAANYDKDVEKQGKQLGLPGW